MASIKQPLGIIKPNEHNSEEIFISNLKYEMFPDKEYKLFKKNNYFVIWRSFETPFSEGRQYDQTEFPLSSIPWFIDTIEKKFWSGKPSPDQLPGDVSESCILNDEKIGINPMKHCCAENLFGYRFWNVSREDYITELTPQNWQIPRFMLEEGLLDQLKKISTDLGLKVYN